MAVKKVGEKYRCNVCGNEVTVTKVGGGELVCCKKPIRRVKFIYRDIGIFFGFFGDFFERLGKFLHDLGLLFSRKLAHQF